MATMGSLGGVVFEVTGTRILTPEKISHSFGAKWAVSDVIGQKPTAQFLAPAQRGMTLGIKLVLSPGLFPEEEADKIRGFTESGEVMPLVIGGVTKGQFYIESGSEEWRNVDAAGNVHTIQMTLNLKEYS
jgi:phage protein U